MRQRRHPEQGYRSCLGVIRLAKTFGHDRLDAACVRALESSLWKAAIGPGHRSGAIGPGPVADAHSYTSLHSSLKNGLDRKARTRVTPSRQHAFACACRVIDEPAITHPNIRHTKGVPILMGSAPLARRADYFH